MAVKTVRFRPVFGRVLAVIVASVAALGIAGFFVTADWTGLARFIWPLLLFAFAGWALFWRPRLVVEEHAVTVVNVMRTFVVPWSAIERIDTHYALTLHTSESRIPVWAAPAPGRHTASRLTRQDLAGLRESAHGINGSVRPSDAVRTESGAAAHVLRTHWEQLRDTGRLEDLPGEPRGVTVRWHIASILVATALLGATVVGSLV